MPKYIEMHTNFGSVTDNYELTVILVFYNMQSRWKYIPSDNAMYFETKFFILLFKKKFFF